MKRSRVALLAAALMWLTPAAAHEYWIEPLRFRVEPGGAMEANLRLGMEFRGSRMPYVDANIVRLEDDGERIAGILGDIPAIKLTDMTPGLHQLVYHSTAERVHWTEYQKFAEFVNDHGLGWVLDRHKARGLPDTGFDEAYTRCAKSLVQVGPVAGSDHAVGLPAELVAQANPYMLRPGDTLPVKVLWHGKPAPDVLVRVFRRWQEQPTISDVVSGPDGVAQVPLAGPGVYMLNAVLMDEGAEKPADVWHSFWASLTFEVAP